MKAEVRRVAIVGGGLLGMALALRLRQRGYQVILIEGAAATGGLAAPETIGGYTWDRFYHVILPSDHSLHQLLEEVGLRDNLRWRATRTGFYVNGTLYSLSSSVDFLTFPPLSILERLRLAFTILYAAHVKDWRRLESIPATEWLRRLSGKRTLERIWRPLLRAKLGENYHVASAAFIWAIIDRLYAARRSAMKREMFGYVDGGYDSILRQLRSRLHHDGIEVRCGQPVVEVTESSDSAQVRLFDGTCSEFDDVILTIPCGRIVTLCPQLKEAERQRLKAVVYQGIVCASVLLRRPLANYYVTNITDSWVPFTAVVEMTTLVDPAAFGGNSLVYLPRYLAQDDPFWTKSDDAIREEFLNALERMYPTFSRTDVLAFRIARVREVQAVSTLHYSACALPALETSLERVFIVNSAQIVNGTLNVDETVRLANKKAAELMSIFEGSRAPRTGTGEPA